MTNDPKVQKLIDRATLNVQKFFKAEQRASAKRIRELIKVHASDASVSGNAGAAVRIRNLGNDIIKTAL